MRAIAKAPSANSALALSVLLLSGLLIFLAAPARAATVNTHLPLYTIDGSATPLGEFSNLTSVAVHDASGTIYAVEGTSGPSSPGVVVKMDQLGNAQDFSALGSPVLDGSNTPEGQFLSLGFPGSETTRPNSDIAVDNSGGPFDGTIYLATEGGGGEQPHRLYAFDPSGSFLYQRDFLPNGGFTNTMNGVSVDGAGSVYVSPYGSGPIFKFQPSSTGLTLLSQYRVYPQDPPTVFSSAVDSAGAMYAELQFENQDNGNHVFDTFEVPKLDSSGTRIHTLTRDRAPGLGVDQSNDHPYLYTRGLLAEYNSNGAPASEFGAATVSGFRVGIAVDGANGKVFVSDPSYDPNSEIDVFGPLTSVTVADALLDPPSGIGFFGATLSGTVDPLGVPTTWHFEYRKKGSSPWLSTPTQNAGSSPGATPVTAIVEGLDHNTDYEARLAVTNTDADTSTSSNVRSFTTVALPPPLLDPVSAVTATSAHLSGAVNPNGLQTKWRFEYSADHIDWSSIPVPDGDAGSGSSDVPVSADLADLEPNTVYFVRLVAVNGGQTTSAERSFKTSPLPPVLTARSAFPVADVTATLRAVVDPNNSETTYYFEYGPDTNYGQRIPVAQDASAGAGGKPIPVQRVIAGLQPETTYHYRVIASSPAGTAIGDDVEFVTLSTAEAAWPERGIELVNPPDKAGQLPNSANQPALLMRRGGRVVWATNTGAPGSPTGKGGAFLSSRTSTGWRTRSLVPPIEQMIGGGDYAYRLLGVAPDGQSVAFNVSRSAIFDPEPVAFARVNEDGSQDEYDLLSQASPLFSDDLHYLFSVSSTQWVPGHPSGTRQIYRLEPGEPPVLVSRMPSNAPSSCGVTPGFAGHYIPSEVRWVSSDGSRVFFETCTGLYRRDIDTGVSTQLSGPPASGTDQGATFLRASADGSAAVFATATNLVANDTNGAPDVYRWDEDAGTDCLTCIVANPAVLMESPASNAFRGILVSADLSHVYFASSLKLVPGQPSSPAGYYLYVWHDETIDYIAPSSTIALHLGYGETIGNSPGQVATTPDGNVFIFASRLSGITPDRNDGNFQQWYRYQVDTKSLECMTCPPPGETPRMVITTAGFANLPETVTLQYPISDDGRTFIFSSSTPYVHRDVNQGLDLYEWHDGRLRLLSDGLSEYENEADVSRPYPLGISSDGVDILFSSGLKLTGHEIEEAPQLYVARTGGGFPPPPAAPAHCVEDSCQGPLVSPPNNAGAASATFSGPGNAAAEKKAKKKHKKKARAKKNRGKRRAQAGQNNGRGSQGAPRGKGAQR